ncbi:hypothetical protein ILUMI_12640 [Ignelater luminosus]|uniref:Uncharacterized protein n=1 Tax=Ignelater luminosus TaxID=2038154 RepID=A0A8K0CTW2_IGNLU|nr:hypothetical protein ILUMI_12640 [Ignelater luminosus]
MSIPDVFKYVMCTASMFYFIFFILFKWNFIRLDMNSQANNDTKVILQKIKSITNCANNTVRYELSKRGAYWVLYKAYIMCILDYSYQSYLILDNAFLVHQPGIQKSKKQTRRFKYSSQTNETIKDTILSEIAQPCGNKSECQCCKS